MSQDLKLTLLSFSGQERTLTYHKSFANFTESWAGALMLSQLLYLHDDEDEWTPMSDDEWKDLLGAPASTYAIRKARQDMEDAGYLETDTRQRDGTPVVHYRLHMDVLMRAWRAFVSDEDEDVPLDVGSAPLDTLLSVPPESVTGEVAMEAWNRLVDTLPEGHNVSRVRKMSSQRKSWVRAKREDLWPNMREIVDRIQHNPFLQGFNDRSWAVDFNWLWEYEGNAIKVIEGKYDHNDTRLTGDSDDPIPPYLGGPTEDRTDASSEDADDAASPYSDVGFRN